MRLWIQEAPQFLLYEHMNNTHHIYFVLRTLVFNILRLSHQLLVADWAQSSSSEDTGHFISLKLHPLPPHSPLSQLCTRQPGTTSGHSFWQPKSLRRSQLIHKIRTLRLCYVFIFSPSLEKVMIQDIWHILGEHWIILLMPKQMSFLPA